MNIKIGFDRTTAHTFTITDSDGKEVIFVTGFTSAQKAFDAAMLALRKHKYGK